MPANLKFYLTYKTNKYILWKDKFLSFISTNKLIDYYNEHISYDRLLDPTFA